MGETEKVLVQVRLPRALVKQLDHLRVDLGMNRTELIEALMRRGIVLLPRVPPADAR